MDINEKAEYFIDHFDEMIEQVKEPLLTAVKNRDFVSAVTIMTAWAAQLAASASEMGSETLTEEEFNAVLAFLQSTNNNIGAVVTSNNGETVVRHHTVLDDLDN